MIGDIANQTQFDKRANARKEAKLVTELIGRTPAEAETYIDKHEKEALKAMMRLLIAICDEVFPNL